MLSFSDLIIIAATIVCVSGCNSHFPPQNPRCGKISVATETNPWMREKTFAQGAWPWMVAIYKVNQGSELFICSGTFILERKVLTSKSIC